MTLGVEEFDDDCNERSQTFMVIVEPHPGSTQALEEKQFEEEKHAVFPELQLRTFVYWPLATLLMNAFDPHGLRFWVLGLWQGDAHRLDYSRRRDCSRIFNNDFPTGEPNNMIEEVD
jgi:hypothetical protein